MGMNLGGIMPAASVQAMMAQEKAAADAANSMPVIQGLAGHIRNAWTTNKAAKQAVETRMLQAMRQRRGEYDPDTLARIRKSGGSEIYMMITAAKCRSITSWLRDTLLTQGSEKPWTMSATPVPTLPPDVTQALMVELHDTVGALVANGVDITIPEVQEMVEMRKQEIMDEARETAKERAENAERYMEDQLVEGGFIRAFSQFLDDLATFPAAIMKGPVVRKRKRTQWVQGQAGWETAINDELVLEWERVDPMMIYPSPLAVSVDDGDLIEKHALSRRDLNAMIGVEGYSDSAIRAVLEEYGRGGLREWTAMDISKAMVEGRESGATAQNAEKTVDALQFWGSVQGQMLVDWGMTAEEVEDPLAEYEIEAWLIGQWVIKAVLNPDPLGRRPYYKTAYEELPGAFWGNGPPDLLRDVQGMANAAGRALANNMGIASGPQVWVNIDRIPPGEDITNLYPWKIHQTTSDPSGSNTQPPVGFFQPASNAQELMAIYEKFSTLADEYTGVPRYMTGESPEGGVGRTASGMSMLMSHAGKILKQVMANIDLNVTTPLIERLHDTNMRYSDDESIKGDLRVVARGMNNLAQKETAQLRRNEFLAATNNPADLQILGLEGRAHLLREAAKGIDIDVDKVVPDPETLRMKQQLAMLTAPPAAMQGQPGQQMGSGQELDDGTPTTDNTQPS